METEECKMKPTVKDLLKKESKTEKLRLEAEKTNKLNSSSQT